MVSATKEIIEKEMTISDIEKKYHVSTQRAVQLFCQAANVSSPNTSQLDAWSKQIIRRVHAKVKQASTPSTDTCDASSCHKDSGSCGEGCSGCSGCH
jgi:hypothetical protein